MSTPAYPMSEDQRRLVWWIRHLCAEQSRGLAKTAYAAGISHQALFDILSGKVSPTLRTISMLAAELGVDVRELFAPVPEGDEAESEPEKPE